MDFTFFCQAKPGSNLPVKSNAPSRFSLESHAAFRTHARLLPGEVVAAMNASPHPAPHSANARVERELPAPGALSTSQFHDLLEPICNDHKRNSRDEGNRQQHNAEPPGGEGNEH